MYASKSIDQPFPPLVHQSTAMDMEMGCDHTVLAHQCHQLMNKPLLVLS